ncbi:MAG: PAS domain S-box protein [Nevskiaceae bacterium]|nr:MAG: PAS domain S-box protein [Nevskiaceae bacterium]TAM33158.1 MAG: PAS domain S-box protein [Nevskiaceae bacterium]
MDPTNRLSTPGLRWDGPATWGAIVFLIGLVFSATLALEVRDGNRQALASLFEQRSSQLSEAVVERVTLYQYGLRGTRGAVLAAGLDSLSHTQFVAYSRSRDLAQEFPGSRGFGFIRRVTPDQLDTFLSRASADRGEVFAPRSLGANEDDRWLIQYIEPEANNRPAIGLDIASEPARRAAAFRAMVSGQPALTSPIQLVQASGAGFLMLLPVYEPGEELESVEQRQRALRGWSYTPLVAEEIFKDLSRQIPNLHFGLTDVTDPGGGLAILGEPLPVERNGLIRRESIELFGRRWQLTTTPDAGLAAELRSPNAAMAFGGGVLTSLLAALLVAVLRLFAERAQASRREQLELVRGIVDASPDAIVVIDGEGRIVESNRQVETLFGRAPQSVVGQDLGELLPAVRPTELAREAPGRTAIGLSTASRQELPARDARGREFPVELHLRPLELQGRKLVVATLRDVSEARAAVQRIQGSEARWRELANSMPQLVWTCRGDGPCDFLSAQWQAYTGIDEESQLGFGWLEQVHPDDRERLMTRWNESVSRHGTFSVEFRIRRHDGVYRWFDTRAEPILDEAGQIRTWIGSNTDIEDRKQAEAELLRLNASLEAEVRERTAALRRSSALQSAVLESAGYSIIATDTEGLITLFNPAAEAMLGYSAVEMIGRQTPAIIHVGDEVAARAASLSEELRKDVPLGFEAFVAKARLGGPDENEWTYVRKDGSRFPVRLKVSAMRDESGVITGFLGIAVDLTESRRREEALSKARQDALQIGHDLRTILDAMPSMVAYWDRDLRNRFANHAYRDWFGVDPERLPGTHLRDLLGSEMFEANRPYVEGALAGQTQQFERLIGHRFSLARYVPDIADGETRGFYAFITDVTALRAATDAAEAASAAKSAFLANMSHEIRTPMNAVMNLCYLLEQTPLNQEQRDLASKMRIASRSLLGLINDVLDLSKIEAGGMSIANEPFSLRRLMLDIEQLMASQAASKRLNFHARTGVEVPDYVRGDSLRINQVLTNLLSNAIKFTDRGEVELKLDGERLPENRIKLHFEVRDTGIGISADALARLFQPFTQADDSTTRRFGGSGLGLAIVSRLVQMMGGKLGVESEPGVGSRFWFSIELPVESQGTLPELAPQALSVLVVDDSEGQREQLVALSRSLGWRAESVATGVDALQRVTDRLRSAQPFDAIIIDWHLPGLDGLATLEELYRSIGDRPSPSIVLVTAGDIGALQALPGSQLADEVLALPVKASGLFNAVHRGVARHSPDSSVQLDERQLSPTLKRLQAVRVLLVDDSSINLDVGQRLLEREGATVRLAADGKQAVDLVAADSSAFDIVLMDVQMPVMDGIEATQRIRQLSGSAQKLPIVALTAGALMEERDRALAAGMDDFISKPFDAESMVLRLRQRVERYLGRPLPLEPKTLSVAAPSGLPAVVGLNLQEALSRVGGDLRLLRSLLRRLLEEFSDFGPGLVVNHDDAERQAIAQLSHKLRGIAGNVGAESLRQAAGELEDCARSPGCAEIPFHLGRIEQQIKSLRLAARDFLADPDQPTEGEATPLTIAELERLRKDLRENRLSALTLAEKLGTGLRDLLGEAGYAELALALQELRFNDALRLLE